MSVGDEGDHLTVSVIICAYTERRWDDLVEAIDSVRSQTRPAHELLVVIDHNDALLGRVRATFNDVTVLDNLGERGLSSARNTAVAAASGDLLAFLDDDAAADEKWLETLATLFTDSDVVGAGGWATPRWDTRRPGWFPPEFDWVVGCTHEGMPLARTDVRNVIGCNMMFRRVALDRTTGFATSLGRIGSVPLGCEETELCIRLRQLDPTARVVFEPRARVRHHVTPERTRFRYFVARNRAEGMSKSVVASLVGSEAGMATERDYLRRILLAAIGRGVRETFSGRLDGGRRAVAIVIGLGSFATGFAQAELSRRLGRSGARA